MEDMKISELTETKQITKETTIPVVQNDTTMKMQLGLLVDIIYPVGSIYMSTNNIDPSNFLGGKWEVFAKGKTLIGVDTDDTDFNEGKKTGGSKTHIITKSELPNIELDVSGTTSNKTLQGKVNIGALNSSNGTGMLNTISGIIGRETTGSGYYDNTDREAIDDMWNILKIDASHNHTLSNAKTEQLGDGTVMDIMNPYITCYIWERIG